MTNWTDEQIAVAREDFRVFLFITWHEIGLPKPTAIQNDIAHSIQFPPSDRMIIEGFRGVAKSFITCAFTAWSLWRDPLLKFLIISASKDRADANAIFIKKILQTIPFLKCMLPTQGQRDTQNLFDVSRALPDASPSVKSVGITGQITGSRADILIADDVEVPNNSSTQVQRDKLNEAVKEFDAILKPSGRIIYLGTPQNEMSLYNNLQDRGYTIIVYPVIYPESVQERNQYKSEQYGDMLAPYIADVYDKDPEGMAGVPTDPDRFDTEEILKRRLSYGKAGFSLQFMLNTNLSDFEKYPLKVSDMIVDTLDIEESSLKWSWANGQQQRINELPCVALKGDYYYAPLSRSPETNKYQMTCMFVDPSGRGKDETAYVILKFLNGYIFVLDVGGFREGYDTSVMQRLATKCKFFKCTMCQVEPNFGNGMFAQLLIPVMADICPTCGVEDAKTAVGQKEARIIDTIEPVMMRHKLIVNTQVIEDDYKIFEQDKQYSLIYQMTRLSRERGSLAHDDRIDALAMGVAFFNDCMSMQETQGMEELEAEQLEKWLDPDYGVLYKEPPPENIYHNKQRFNSYDETFNVRDHYLIGKV